MKKQTFTTLLLLPMVASLGMTGAFAPVHALNNAIYDPGMANHIQRVLSADGYNESRRT